MIAIRLDQKIKNWLATLPEPLALFLEDKVFIAGGAIASLLAAKNPAIMISSSPVKRP